MEKMQFFKKKIDRLLFLVFLEKITYALRERPLSSILGLFARKPEQLFASSSKFDVQADVEFFATSVRLVSSEHEDGARDACDEVR